MKFYFFYFGFFLTSDLINCLIKPDDFCKKDIRINKCTAYNCGSIFCTFDKELCKSLISWGHLIKKYNKEPKVFNSFIAAIKLCMKREYKNQWLHRMNFG
jgi:hypothetical protein